MSRAIVHFVRKRPLESIKHLAEMILFLCVSKALLSSIGPSGQTLCDVTHLIACSRTRDVWCV